MLHKEYNGIQWLEFELLAECPLVHACLMRHGGCSSGSLDSLNLGRHVGDAPENVHANFQKVSEALSLPLIASAKIVHGAEVQAIDHCQTPISDGLMTRAVGLGLSVSQADCQAAIFYDPVNHAVANVHCGWRSSVLNIYEQTVKSMRHAYGTQPENLLVCISPSLGPESSQFINYRQELPEPFWQFQVKPLYFDFWAISAWQLKMAGVLPDHIQIAGIDTFVSQDFFSHRRDRPGGRQATICALK